MHTNQILQAMLSLSTALATAASTPIWEILPPTPSLPGNAAEYRTRINGVDIWHAEFGSCASDVVPILMLHGGFGNSDYFGSVIDILMKDHCVIAMDTRGHGRSTMDATPFTYELYASDVATLLRTKNIPKAAWVGWSDMGIGTLAALMNSADSPLVDRAFVYGATHNPQSTNTTFSSTAIYREFTTRAVAEYTKLQPTGNLTAFANAVVTLESTLPQWTKANFDKISLGNKLTVADGQFEEAVVLNEPALLHSWIKGSKLVTMTNVSHFAPVQDPKQFAAKLQQFLI